jgi:hypothetical protein
MNAIQPHFPGGGQPKLIPYGRIFVNSVVVKDFLPKSFHARSGPCDQAGYGPTFDDRAGGDRHLNHRDCARTVPLAFGYVAAEPPFTRAISRMGRRSLRASFNASSE